MAYVLGYSAADGCLIKRKDRKNSWVFNITSKDKEHLENIRDAMASKHAISQKWNNGQKVDCYHLQISNFKICQDLVNLGIRPRKSSTLNPVPVPSEYFHDFVRGFFDGDGTVYIYSVNDTSQIKAGFVCCSKNFIDNLNYRLCKNLKIIPKSIHRVHQEVSNKLTQYSICFYITDCEKLADYIYQNKPRLYLLRKKKIFDDWKLIERRGYIKKNYPTKIGWHLNLKSTPS